MASANLGNFDYRQNSIDVAVQEAGLRIDVAKAKANFCRSRHALLLMTKFQNLQSSGGFCDACFSMNTCMENAIEVLSMCASFYIEHKMLQNGNSMVREMEQLETDFYAAYETAWAYLDSQNTRTSNQVSDKVGTLDKIKTCESIRIKEQSPSPNLTSKTLQTESRTNSKPGYGLVEHNTTIQYDAEEQNRSQNNENRENPNQNIAESCTTPSIGQDLWTQLERVKVPTFFGDKRHYPTWKAAFMGCIDNAPVTPEYKLLQLRQYGEALEAIENLGHSSFAYKAAKDRLERKYGGKRRRIAIFLEDLERFQQIPPDNAVELERFADLLDLTVINLKEAGEDQDLGDGSLYIQLQRKLPQSLLARYHRWLFENNVVASVIALKTWVNEESRFQTIAAETVNGLTSQTDNIESTPPTRNTDHRTFFINERTCHPQQKQSCQICKEQHRIWECHTFMQNDISKRWNIARKFKLCYRCLAEGHQGNACRKTRRCGIDSCHQVHHRLLHIVRTGGPAISEQTSNTEQKLKLYTKTPQDSQEPESACSEFTFGMEGNRFTEQEKDFAHAYFAGCQMKIDNMNDCSSVNKSKETVGLIENARPGNTTDERVISSNTGEQLRCQAENSYSTNDPIPNRRTFSRRGTNAVCSSDIFSSGRNMGVRPVNSRKDYHEGKVERFA